jgi:hypothetical protein
LLGLTSLSERCFEGLELMRWGEFLLWEVWERREESYTA